MRLLILTLAIMGLFAAPAFAAKSINIKVNGMVCDFCAQSVWKVFNDYDAVEDTLVDLDKAMVIVTLKEGQDLTDEQLEKAINYSGYDFVSLERIDE